MLVHQDLLEYFAAQAPWAVFNVHRKEGVEFFFPQTFMPLRTARLGSQGLTASQGSGAAPGAPSGHGRPALLVEPAPEVGMRWAQPGERPPSRFAPGQSDGVIERFDAYVRQVHHG